MSGLSIIILLFILIAFKVPVVYALGLSALSFFLTNDIALQLFSQRIVVGADNFALLAAPFFILAGNIMNTGGITNRIFRFANALVGHFRGGLGHVNVLGSMLFAGMSGSAIADAAGLGAIEIKAMTDAEYDLEFSTAITAASAIIGPIIPPSTIMVVFGVTAGVSVGKLFLGGIIPGIMIGIAELALVAYYSHKRNYPKNDTFRFKVLFRSFIDCFWALLTPIIIIGGILGGVFTPTESGAIASLYALIISLFVYKDIKLRDIPKILYETALISGVILLIVSTAGAFGWCLTYDRVPQTVALALTSITNSKILLMAILSVIYLFLGMIMEASAIVITTVPIFVPVLNALGIDLVYFGVIVAILMAIGTITPPVGTVLFILSKITGMPIEKLSKELLPWYGALAVVLIILLIFPPIIQFVPKLIGG